MSQWCPEKATGGLAATTQPSGRNPKVPECVCWTLFSHQKTMFYLELSHREPGRASQTL